MKTIEIEMKYSKSTKNTHVYRDDSEESPVPTLYVKRGALPDNRVDTIKVTITHE